MHPKLCGGAIRSLLSRMRARTDALSFIQEYWANRLGNQGGATHCKGRPERDARGEQEREFGKLFKALQEMHDNLAEIVANVRAGAIGSR